VVLVAHERRETGPVTEVTVPDPTAVQLRALPPVSTPRAADPALQVVGVEARAVAVEARVAVAALPEVF